MITFDFCQTQCRLNRLCRPGKKFLKIEYNSMTVENLNEWPIFIDLFNVFENTFHGLTFMNNEF